MAKAPDESVTIKTPNFVVAEFTVIGTAPYVSNKFSEEARRMMTDEMKLGGRSSTRKAAKERPARDFEAESARTLHTSPEGWHGIPATAFKAAMVRACKTAGLEMKTVKGLFHVLPDGFDGETPIVRILDREPQHFESYVLTQGRPNISARQRFEAGWRVVLNIQFDADFIPARSISALIMRAGICVGVGAGRPDSTTSVGQGWGTFKLAEQA